MQVEILGGGLDCWVFLSGLEVLRHCEKLTDSSQPRAQALNTANLWDYVCRKVYIIFTMITAHYLVSINNRCSSQ